MAPLHLLQGNNNWSSPLVRTVPLVAAAAAEAAVAAASAATASVDRKSLHEEVQQLHQRLAEKDGELDEARDELMIKKQDLLEAEWDKVSSCQTYLDDTYNIMRCHVSRHHALTLSVPPHSIPHITIDREESVT